MMNAPTEFLFYPYVSDHKQTVTKHKNVQAQDRSSHQ